MRVKALNRDPDGSLIHQHINHPAGDDEEEIFWPSDTDRIRREMEAYAAFGIRGNALARLVIHGEPVPAGRPRFSNGHAFDPKRSRDYKRFVGQEAKMKYHGPLLRNDPLKVDVKVYRHVQRSVSKVERTRRISGEHRPIVKPDASNYLKLIEDALTGIVWEDDNLITDVSCSKYYSDEPRIEVTVTEA
ncbi:RusA family crossover junction endodeoxyribonuclease [Levilactobacillus suantsaii]|uniref:RusA family crossover junction endodeoxyribonuclease n=1 Tax=Levilactobacillus suantsaii TaxID=2292255 RepID=UPI001CDD7B4A|nr:RusA family crossover junction endodeoxyribonuclease [Levilactobacillus suantsaii]